VRDRPLARPSDLALRALALSALALSALALRRRLLVARQDLAHALPGRHEVEAAEFLLQLHRLVDDALLLLLLARLDIAAKRKVLAHRLAFEAVIGEDAPQIGMAREIDAVEIPGLALEPAGGAEDAGDRGHEALLVGGDLDADALIELEAQEIVDHLEALGPVGIVDAAEVDHDLEKTLRIVTQEGHDADDVVTLHAEDELVVGDLDTEHGAGLRRRDGVAKVFQRLGHGNAWVMADRSIIPVGGRRFSERRPVAA